MRRELPRAVLFDVDGTLYHQPTLRALMALELASLPLARLSLASARRTWRAVGCFRRVREELRGRAASEVPLAQAQFLQAAERAGVEPAEMEAAVSEWIFERPLKYLRLCRRSGVEALFSFLASRGVQVGVFSDYPVTEKLEALGLSGRVSVALCATDPEIGAFKPDPRGWLRACALWGLEPREVLYVGDRPEGAGTSPPGFSVFSSFTGLQHALDVGG
jgi:FMN phosphatase YigB (HAD superfamily)